METAENEVRDRSYEEQIILFGLHNELFGFNISLIDEITEVAALNAVPKAPDCIIGVTNYHGKIVAVLSLARFFNLPSHERGALSRIIVLALPGYSVGLLVDNVKEITYSPVESDERNPMEGEDFKNIYVEKVLSVGDSLVNMINIKKLLTDLEGYFKEVNVEH
jgi:purine-binding chemotaxis protein CheW